MAKTHTPTAAALIIGNEILSGQTQDANINAIARKLFELGIKLAEVRVVPDAEAEIIEALNTLRTKYTYVFTTGGIGSTHDDVTAASVAKAFGLPLVENPKALAMLEAHYAPEKMIPSRVRMSLMPKGAELVTNHMTGAPGFKIENVYVMAGVPSIMKGMLENVAVNLSRGDRVHVKTIRCTVLESLLADELAVIAARHPRLDIGSYPSFELEKVSLSLVVRGTEPADVEKAAQEIASLIKSHGGEPVEA